MTAGAHISRAVLIVDDDEDLRETLVEALRFEGFRTDGVANGQQALDWLQRHHDSNCVVVLDLMMPVMDGKTFLRTRAADPSLPRGPVIVLTAAGDCREVISIADVVRCYPKTVTLAALAAAIHECP